MREDSERKTQISVFVGPGKITAMEGMIEDGEPRILRHVTQKDPEGFEKGFVTNLERAASSLESLVQAFTPGKSEEEIPVFAVLDNSKLKTYSFSSSQYYQGFQRTVSPQEIRSVVEQTRSVATLPLSEFVLQTVPESFIVNDLEGIRNPLGLDAQRLGVYLKIHTMNFQEFKNLSKAFEAAGLAVRGFFPSTLTLSEAILTNPEKEDGVLLMDIEDDRIHMVLWKSGGLVAAQTFDLKEKSLSSQIAKAWGIELHDAEKVRERYASLETKPVSGEELIPLIERNGKGNNSIHRQDFHEKFAEQSELWLREIFAVADAFTEENRVLHPHLVISGSGTSIDGFLEFLQTKFSRTARIGLAKKIDAPNEVSVDPSMSGALGIYRWIATQMREQKQLLAPQGFLQKTLASTRDWFSAYF